MTIRLGPARRMYVKRLMGTGLHGDSPEEVVETIFCRGLQECVRPEWMREVTQSDAAGVEKP